MHYLAGLAGAFRAFARTDDERDRTGDERRSIAERYSGRDDYLARVRKAVDDLVRQRFIREDDVSSVLRRAGVMWDSIAGR